MNFVINVMNVINNLIKKNVISLYVLINLKFYYNI